MKYLALAAICGFSFLCPAAFAAVSYQPEGQAVPLDQAVTEMVTKGFERIRFYGDHIYLEFGHDGKTERFAETSVEQMRDAVSRLSPVTKVKSGDTVWELSWGRAQSTYSTAYDLMESIAEQAQYADPGPAETPEELENNLITIYAKSIRPLSVTGSLITYRTQGSGYYGGMHIQDDDSFGAYDLTKYGKASLLDYVDNQSLLESLKKDSFLLRAMKRAKRLPEFLRTTQLTELASLAAKVTGDQGEGAMWAEGMDQFQEFAIYDYDAQTDEVLVRLALEYYDDDDKGGEVTQIGVRVKPTAEFAKTLARVQKTGGGFFMKGREKPRG